MEKNLFDKLRNASEEVNKIAKVLNELEAELKQIAETLQMFLKKLE